MARSRRHLLWRAKSIPRALAPTEPTRPTSGGCRDKGLEARGHVLRRHQVHELGAPALGPDAFDDPGGVREARVGLLLLPGAEYVCRLCALNEQPPIRVSDGLPYLAGKGTEAIEAAGLGAGRRLRAARRL